MHYSSIHPDLGKHVIHIHILSTILSAFEFANIWIHIHMFFENMKKISGKGGDGSMGNMITQNHVQNSGKPEPILELPELVLGC